MIEAENIYQKFHKRTIAIYHKFQHNMSIPRQIQVKTYVNQDDSSKSSLKSHTNTDNNRFPNTKPKVQQVANHLTNY